MKIIVSPTKQMKVSEHEGEQLPYYADVSKEILAALQALSVEELCKLMHIKESIALENQQRYQDIDFSIHASAAIYTYQGLQFKHMQIDELSLEDIEYVKEHLRILSAFYGIVRPMDSIQPYRLEMQSRLAIQDAKDVYGFWKDRLAKRLLEEDEEKWIINLASKEYAKAVLPYLDKGKVTTITFYVDKDGKLKTESTQVKMARGRFVQWMAKNKVSSIQELKMFQEDGYHLHQDLSTDEELIFVKKKER